MHALKYIFICLSILLCSCSIGQKHDTTTSYVEDATITTNVKAAIFQQAAFHNEEIYIETINGIVKIRGFAQHPDQIKETTEIIKNVSGVKGVKNNLKVKREENRKEPID